MVSQLQEKQHSLNFRNQVCLIELYLKDKVTRDSPRLPESTTHETEQRVECANVLYLVRVHENKLASCQMAQLDTDDKGQG